MRFGTVALATLGLFALAGTPAPTQPKGDGEAGRYGWNFSLADGLAKAKQSGKPLMVVLRCVP